MVKQDAIQAQTTLFKQPKKSPLDALAGRLSIESKKLYETLKSTVFKECRNDEEMAALVIVANTYDLNPFLKEIYAFPAKGGGIVPIVSVDGWNKMMLRAENFDGIEFDFTDDDCGNPVSCTATVYLKNRAHPVKVTEYLRECQRPSDPWKNMPRRMLRHKALIQAARIGFGFGGVYDEDEGTIIANVEPAPSTEPQKPKLIDTTPTVTSEPKNAPELKLEAPSAVVEGEKTKRIVKVLDANGISHEKALAYFGEMGHATFEEVHERTIESIEKRPENFKKAVLG